MKFKRYLALFCAILLPASALPLRVDAEKDDFLNRLTFFGESTTTHLRSRSEIPSDRVWANRSGTAKLDSTLISRPLRFSDGERTPVEAAAKDHPEVIVLSFGLNGVLYFSDHPNAYLQSYRQLINALQSVSPETRFLIQTVYPVAENAHQASWSFSVPPTEINRRIGILNEALRELCDPSRGVELLDTARTLINEKGFLRGDYTTDGIHLNESAYRAVLKVLREYGKGFFPSNA